MTATAADERSPLPGPTWPPSAPPSCFPSTDRRRVVQADDPCEAGFSGADPEYAGIYLHARYFDPQLGTFLSPDPLDPTLPGVGRNRYIYGFGDPLSWIDRSGLESCSVLTDGDRAGEPHCQGGSVTVGPSWGQDKMTSPTQDPGTNQPTQTPGHGRTGGGGGTGGRKPGNANDQQDSSIIDPDANGDGVVDPDELHNAIWSLFEANNPYPYDTHPSSYAVNPEGYAYAFIFGVDVGFTILSSPLAGATGTISAWIRFVLGSAGHAVIPNHWQVWGKATWHDRRRRPERPGWER